MSRRHASPAAAASVALVGLSWALRAAAWVVMALVALGCLNLVYRFAPIALLLGVVQDATPAALRGLWSLETPFGGLFRTDFALLALALLALDWACLRASASLR